MERFDGPGRAGSHWIGTVSLVVASRGGDSTSRNSVLCPRSHGYYVNLISAGIYGQDLIALTTGYDDATRLSNTLSTAHDAIDVIGGLLTNIQSVLNAATKPTDPIASDAVSEQSRIDSAVSTIDAIASGAHFGGRNLLDGTFTLSGSGGLSLPSFMSNVLGSVTVNDASVALNSLTSGGANSLSTGNLTTATHVLTSALAQVSSSQASIDVYRAAALSPGQFASLEPVDLSVSDQLFLAAAQMLLEPQTASSTTANSTPSNILALIQPFWPGQNLSSTPARAKGSSLKPVTRWVF